MRKILIATPLRANLPPAYFNLLYNVSLLKLDGVTFCRTFPGGASVQWARDEAVKIARDKGCTEIIWWDGDIEPSMDDFLLLVKRPEEFVCALYAKRDLFTHWHATGLNKEPQPDGLMPVFHAAIGFSKISMSVFDKILAANPERAYVIKNAGFEPVHLFEYFPMERFGPNTAQGKLKRLQSLKDSDSLSEVAKIIRDSDYSTNAMLGEDYSFCRMAREAGVQIYVATNIIVPHCGDCLFPIPTRQLQDMLKEEWRQDEIVAEKQIRLRSYLGRQRAEELIDLLEKEPDGVLHDQTRGAMAAELREDFGMAPKKEINAADNKL